RVRELLQLAGGGPGAPDLQAANLQKWLAARTGDAARVRAARQRLVEYGLPEAGVRRFPALQVILLDEKYLYEVWRDEIFKALALPYWQAEPVVEASEAAFKAADKETLLAWAVPAVMKVRQAQAR